MGQTIIKMYQSKMYESKNVCTLSSFTCPCSSYTEQWPSYGSVIAIFSCNYKTLIHNYEIRCIILSLVNLLLYIVNLDQFEHSISFSTEGILVSLFFLEKGR